MREIAAAAIILIMVYSTALAEGREGSAGITIEQAIEIAVREVPGDVMEAELEDGVYEIKIKGEGAQKIKVKIDYRDGAVIRKGKIIKVVNRDVR